MRERTNEEYMAVLGALGAAIENNKNDLAFAKYEIERLQKKLEEAHREIAELNSLIPTVNGAGVVENSELPFD
jgi:chromosome segregation ATPase